MSSAVAQKHYGDIPSNVDPLSAGVEISYQEGDIQKSMVLVRSRDDKQQLPCSVASETAVHLFANSHLISRSKVVLCFNRLGGLYAAFERDKRNVWCELPTRSELASQMAIRPSVRVVFDSEADAKSFFALVDGCIRNERQQAMSFLVPLLRKAKSVYQIPIVGNP